MAVLLIAVLVALVTTVAHAAPPLVVSSIPDTLVVEDSAPVDNYRDLNAVFADPEDGDSLAFALVSNSNPGLVAAVIDADSALDLSFAPDASGAATLVIRATDSELLAVDDTVVVTVSPVNDAPFVAAAIPDTTLSEDIGADNYRDLNTVFDDIEDGGALAFAVDANSNPGLVTATIDADSALDIALAPNQSGSAELIVRATDAGGLSVTDTMLVTVSPVNDTPFVAAAIPDTTVLENAPPVPDYRLLTTVFDDVEDGVALTFAVTGNTAPSVVTATVDTDSTLDLDFAPDSEGTATITVRATDAGGLWVEESFDVWVHRTFWHVYADGSGQRPDIQSALNAAVDGDTVMLYDGTYAGSGNRDLGFDGKAILLTSENGSVATIIDCQGGGRGLRLTNGEGAGTTVSGVTITNATQVNGAGIQISGGAPNLIDVVILNCTASRGGGIFVDGGANPTILDCVIAGNSAGEGGGIYMNGGGGVIDGCTIVDNTGGDGIYVRSGASPTITNTVIAFNMGEGIRCNGNPVIDCTNVFGNTAGDGLCGTDAGGNISADPLFCGVPSSGDVRVATSSPCAPANNGCGVLIGAGPAVCNLPQVVSAIPDTTLVRGSTVTAYRDLNDVFYDADDGDSLAFTIAFNSGPGTVSAFIDADSALGLVADAFGAGAATIVVRATDSDGVFADDTLTVSVVGRVVATGAPIDDAPIRPGYPARNLFALRLENTTAVAETLSAVTFANATLGPGTTSQLDADVDTLSLRLAGGGGVLPGADPGPATATFSSGVAAFSGLELVVPPAATVTARLQGGASLEARDGDSLGVRLDADTSLGFVSAVIVDGTFPLGPPELLAVDGMVAAQMTLHSVGSGILPSGSARNLALDVTIPQNGYAADTLYRINVVDYGDALPGADVSTMEAWSDDGDGAFDPNADTRLGAFSFTGSRWELTGIAVDVIDSIRVFVSVDVNAFAVDGRTVRLGLPALPDVGAGMESGNGGPNDVALPNPSPLTIASTDAVVISSVPLPPVTARPGDSGVILFHIVASNNYTTARELTRLTFDNASASVGSATQAELDAEFSVLSLRLDANDNGILDDLATDPVAGTAFFDGGAAAFEGLSFQLPAGGSRHVFVTGNVSLAGARDGDVLGARLSEAFDVGFSQASTVVGSWPLESVRATVDGAVAAQFTVFGVETGTRAPGDGPFEALDVLLPGDGYADDVFNGLSLVNLGTATASDLVDVRMWRDGGDGVLTPGSGDDVELGPMVYSSGAWRTPVLSETLPHSGMRVFAGITVDPGLADSATVRFAIPTGGMAVSSGNDGPTDSYVGGGQGILLSTAPLLVSLNVSPAASAVGQNVSLEMVVRNVGGEPIDGISPTAPMVQGDAVLSLLGGPQPGSVDLAVGEQDTFTWVYRADAPGVVRWSGGAQGTGGVSGLTRVALESSSGEHRVYAQAGDLDLIALDTMPPQIGRGQSGLVPLSLSFSPSGGAQASDVRLLGLRVRLEDGSGAGVVPADVVERISVGEGGDVFLSRTSLETTGDEIDLTFAAPVTVSQEPVTLAIRMDILSLTPVSEFRVVIPDSAWIVAENALSGAPVTARVDGGSYPIRSGLGRLTVPPSRLDVRSMSGTTVRNGWGQAGVEVMDLEVENAGTDGLTTELEISRIHLALADTNGVALATPWTRVDRVRLTGPSGQVADVAWPVDSTRISLGVSPPLTLPVNTPAQLVVEADLADSTTGAFRVEVAAAGDVDARDPRSGNPVAVALDATPLPGPNIIVERSAASIATRSVASFPASVVVGDSNVPAVSIVVRHPGGSDVAGIRVDALGIRFQDEQRNPIVPGAFLTRIRISEGGVPLADVTSVPATGSRVDIPLASITLAPGSSRSFDVSVDVSPAAPQSFLELVLDPSDVVATDANSGGVVVAVADAGASFPLTSGLTRLISPATELRVGFDGAMPAALVPGDGDVAVASLDLTNTAADGSGTIDIDYVVIRAASANGNAIPIGGGVERARILDGSMILGESALLSGDSVTALVPLSPPVSLAPGETITGEVRLDLAGAPTLSGLRVGFDAADIGVDQPASVLLRVNVVPAPGLAFPLWTEAGGFNARSLGASFSNFPNPFAAGVRGTTFVYYLDTDARVSLRIWTARGDGVVTLLDGAARPAGLYQEDIWDGRNGRGVAVVNGVYVAELEVEFEDGRSERLLRKVAVVR